MRRGAAVVALGLAGALGGCSYPEKELVDGQGPPFGCLNAPAPTKADNPVVISGTATDPFTLMPINNAAIAGQLPSLTTPIFVAHSDSMGKFTQSQNTGGMPMDLYLAASANGFITTYYYPAYPVTHDVAFEVQLLTQQDASTLAAAAQVTFNPSNGNVLLTVNDCNGTPVSGATITTTPAGTIRYFNGVQPSTTATSTDMAGVAMIANLPPGNVMLSASVTGMALKSHNFQIVAGAFIQTQIQP